MTVLTLAGGTVITPDGPRRMPEPGPAAKMLARLWTVTGPGGLLLLAPGEPSWSYLLTEDSPWTVTGGPAWFTLTRGSDRMRAGLLGEMDLANDPLIGPDLAATTRRHQRFGDLLGVPFYADGGATGALLLDATVNTKGAPVLRAWHDQKAPRAAEGPWPGPWTPRGEYQPGVQLDKNAHFLCAANSAVLPMDGLRPLKADFYEEVAEFWTGLWEIKVPDNPELRLPHPVAGGARPGSWRWVAQPTLDLLAELGIGQRPAHEVEHVARPEPAHRRVEHVAQQAWLALQRHADRLAPGSVLHLALHYSMCVSHIVGRFTLT